MPGYTVTVYPPGKYGACGVEGCFVCLPRYSAENEVVEPTSHPADTLEKARWIAYDLCPDAEPWHEECESVEPGESIGPLPDGSTITVEADGEEGR